MNIITRLDLSPVTVEKIVLEWYKTRCNIPFKNEDNIDLEEHLCELISVSDNIEKYGNINLIDKCSNRLIIYLLPYFKSVINSEIKYEDLYYFPLRHIINIDFDVLRTFKGIGDKSIYELKELIEKETLM